MDRIKKVMVCVDLTEMDEALVRYVARLSNMVDLEQVYFINVMENMELPEKIIEKYPDLLAPKDEATKKSIQFTIDQEAGNQLKVAYEIKVTDGSRPEKILKWAKIKEVDLIIMGRKSGLEGEAIVSGKVVRLAPCSVMLIPEILPYHFNKIVIPIDFSHASKLALEAAVSLASRIPALKLTCLNIYDVPTGYSVSGKSYDEFAEIMKQNAQDSYYEFIEDLDLKGIPIEARFEFNKGGNIVKKIYKFAIKDRASAIIMGSKGRTQAASILLGSIAEKLIKLNFQIPLLVVKQKRSNMDFLEALLEL